MIGYFQPQAGSRHSLPAPFGGSIPGAAFGMPSISVQRPPITNYLPPGMHDGARQLGMVMKQPVFATAGLSGLGEVSSDAAASFLEDAKRRISALANRAQVIGPPPFFASAAYEQQWDGVLDSIHELQNEARPLLENEPDARGQFSQGINSVNNAIAKLRLNGNQAAYELVVSALTLNPIRLISTVRRIVSDVGLNVQDLGTAAVQTYGEGGWLDIGKYAKWAAIAVAAVVGLQVVSAVRR